MFVVWNLYGRCLFVASSVGCRLRAVQRLHVSVMTASDSPNCTRHRCRTASCIVIGDEILKGQVRDTNSHFLAKQLHSLGVKLEKVCVISDTVKAISDEVREHSDRYDFVVTTGGIGPTHDDVTFEGVAAAFNDETSLNTQLVAFVSDYFKTDDLNEPCFKLAQVPTKCRLLYGEDRVRGIRARFPVINVNNVYIFPGVPSLFEKAFSLLSQDYFVNRERQVHCSTVYLCKDEVTVASTLNTVVHDHPDVTFGSYPELYHSYYQTRVTIEADNLKMVSLAEKQLTAALPGDAVINYNSNPIVDSWRHLQTISQTSDYVSRAVGVLEKCFKDYSWNEISLCFNGGKDCTAVLHLIHALSSRDENVSTDGRPPLRAIYIQDSKPFPELEKFVQESSVRYGLDLFMTAGPIRVGLERMLEHWPDIRACVMGTRLGDPHSGEMQNFTPTDANWPPLMRVSPILEWDYVQLWRFVRGLSLPYCSLYDKGYTSLGSVDNTLPNPALQYRRSDGSVSYRPAHELTDGKLERAGRIKSQH